MISKNFPYSNLTIPEVETSMEAARIVAPNEIKIVSTDLPKPGRGEVRIKLQGCGLCASNIPVYQGREWFDYPIANGSPGHEGWGIIDAVGPGVKGFAVRERVTGLTYNAFATYDIAAQENLVKLPDFLDGKPFPGEPLGCAMNIFKRSDISEGQTVAVVGCGFLGLLLVQLLKSAGCTVIALSKRTFSLEKASEFGADHVLPLEDHHHIIEAVKKMTNGNFCDRVIECTGLEWPLNLAIELTGTRKKLIIAGYHQDGMRSVNVQMLNWRGIDVVNAHEREPQEYIKGIHAALEAIQLGKIDPFPLFTHTYILDNIKAGFEALCERPDGFIKALLIYENDY